MPKFSLAKGTSVISSPPWASAGAASPSTSTTASRLPSQRLFAIMYSPLF